jgi:hypothetical protein
VSPILVYAIPAAAVPIGDLPRQRTIANGSFQGRPDRMSLSRELTIPKNGCGQAKWHKKVEQNGTRRSSKMAQNWLSKMPQKG